MDPDMQIGRFVIGTLITILIAIGLGFLMGCHWMKEKYNLWTRKEIEDQMWSN